MPSTVLFTVGATAITTGAVLAFVAKIAISYAISALLAPRQRTNSARAANFFDEAASQNVSALSPVGNHEIVYGTVRKGGTVVFQHVTPVFDASEFSEQTVVPPTPPYTTAVNPDNGVVLTTTLAVEAMTLVQVDDQLQYQYTPMTLIYSGTPADGQVLTDELGHYEFNAAQAGANVRIRYNQRSGTVAGKYLHRVYVLAAHTCEAIDDIYFDDELVTLDANGTGIGKWAGYVLVQKHLGYPGQPVDVYLNGDAPDKWTAAHRGEGMCYLYVRFYRDRTPGPWVGGVPNVSAIVRGKRDIYDRRDGSVKFTNNAALCLADYLHSTYGLEVPYGYTTDGPGIGSDQLIAAANLCDEAVPLAGGGTEPRYTLDGVVDTGLPPREILARMLSAMAGRLVRVGGQWKIYPGAYTAPLHTYTESELAGPIKTTALLSARDAFNGVKGVYISPQNHYTVSDFPPVASDTAMAEHGGVRVWKDIELPFTTSPSMAQRLAKIELLRGGQEISHVLPMKLHALREEPGDTIALTLAKYGYAAKAFEVAEMNIDLGPRPLVEVIVRETAANVYDWDASEETRVDPAPNTRLPDPFVVAAPGVPTVTEELFEHFQFGVRVRGNVSWGASPDGSVRSYHLMWRRRDELRWSEQTGITATTAQITDVREGAYLIQVAAVNAIGVRSLWVQKEIIFIALSAPPANVSGFTVAKVGGVALAQWTASTDLDVKINGKLLVRHSPLTSGAAWNDGMLIGEFPGNAVNGTLPLVTGTYMAKFEDSSLKTSATESSFVVTEGGLSGYTTVANTIQHSAFTGSKTNLTVDGGLGGLRLTSVASVPALGTYLFDTHVDMTTVATRRFEADVKVLSYSLGSNIDSRLTNIDTWTSFDGDLVNDTAAVLYARVTDDNPAGAPVWGPWVPFVVAEFTCRAAQFKLELTSGDSLHNIVCKTLAVDIKTA